MSQMEVEINTTLFKSADGVTLDIDGTATTFYHGDKVLIKHNKVKLIEFEVVGWSDSSLHIKLKKLMGNDTSHNDSIVLTEVIKKE